MKKSQTVLGVDLGGTTLRAALFIDGTSVAVATRGSALTPEERLNPATVMLELVHRVSAGRRIDAVCIAATGPVDVVNHRINNPYTLPDWSGSSWPEVLSDALEAPVLMENDTVAAAVGEFRDGAGRGAEVMCMVTIGTGIGVAVIGSESSPYRGAGFFHPEAGHLLISDRGDRCYCGFIGCWESLCSGTALSSHWKLQTVRGMTPEVDWDGYAEVFARGIVNLNRVYVPDVIVLGGGVSESFDSFSPALMAALGARDAMGPASQPRIVKTQLEQPGTSGAGHLAMDFLASRERQ